MNNTERHPTITPPSGDPAQEIETALSPMRATEITGPSRANRARGFKLSQQLRVHTFVDDSGWLLDDAELRYERGHRGTIRPVMVRVGPQARDEDLLVDGGVLERCRRYNRALESLRRLGIRLAAAIDPRSVAMTPGSPIASAHDELSRLDALIAHRQVLYMAHGAVRVARLAQEIEFFEDRYSYLESIVSAAEQGLLTVWDGNTEEMTFDD